MKKQFVYLTLALAVGMVSCSSEETESIESSMEDEILEVIDSVESEAGDLDMLNNLIVSMPSPLETSFAIKESGADYNSDFLNPIENIEKYNDEGKKAMNMGVYGADLGYINIYEKQLHTVSYVTCLKTLAEDLNVGHFFDLEAIERMSSASENMDSMLIESTKSYNEMDHFLREQNRSNLSVLMAVGAWAEGMNILGQVYSQTKNEDLKNKIAEQGIVVETITSLVDYYKDDANLKPVIPLVEEISGLYNQVEVNVVEGETEMIEVDGELQIIDNGYTEYIIKDETMASLLEKVTELRNTIIL